MTPAEQIKQKLDIVDFLSGYIQLKPAGSSHKARCPFHNEKTPSFIVNRERQSWHCFGCNEGGDIFTFVEKMEGLDFPEALKMLAERAGVKLEYHGAPKDTSKKHTLLEINRLAAELFHKVLTSATGREADAARAYVDSRGLTKDTIAAFKIGYAPESWDFATALVLKKGFPERDLIDAGIAIRGTKGVYDRFRGRVMFPITNAQGNVIGFTGRVLDETKQQGGKYVNSPQTELYNKSQVLFGLDKAKQEIRKQQRIVVVEGNMDVIASHQAGITNVVAASGTAFTEEQLQLIRRFTTNLYLCFDEDAAGQQAADKSIDLAMAQGFSIRVVELPRELGGKKIKDPDDCIKAGRDYWQKAIDSAVDVMQYYFDKYTRVYPTTSAAGKKQFTIAMLGQIKKLDNAVEQDEWLSKTAQKIGVSEHVLRESFMKVKENRKTAAPTSTATATKKPRESTEQRFLSLIIKFPTLITYAIDHIPPEALVDNELLTIYKSIILRYSNPTQFTYTEFEHYLTKEHPALVATASLLPLHADQEFADYGTDAAEKELFSIIKSLKRSYVSRRLSDVQEQLRVAEQQKNSELITRLAHEFNQLNSDLNSLHN